jgi:hypothetical protein
MPCLDLDIMYLNTSNINCNSLCYVNTHYHFVASVVHSAVHFVSGKCVCQCMLVHVCVFVFFYVFI